MHKNHLYFDENPNGKLFADCFNDIRVNDIEALVPGREYDIFLQEQYIGTAQLVGKRDFQYKHLSDVLTYLSAGKPLNIYAARLKMEHPETEWDTTLTHIVLKWTKRDEDMQARFIHQWWRETFNNAANDVRPTEQTGNIKMKVA